MNQCAVTLTEATEKYLIRRQIDKKKYFVGYLSIASDVWKWMYVNLLNGVTTKWYPVKKGEPYNYIDAPVGAVRIYSVNEVNKAGNIVPLFYNEQMNVVPKPVTKKCGCNECDCSGLCEAVNSMDYTTKYLFTNNGIEYYEKIWTKFCSNGDVLEYREVPTKKYNDYVGNSGDFNDDFNDDFSGGGGGFPNYEIVTEKFQKKLCALTVRPCGCPENTEENRCLLQEFCGCYIPKKYHYPEIYLPDINSNHRGEVKISECGSKIYYRSQVGKFRTHPIPDFLQVSFQTNGASLSEESLVPDFALNSFFSNMDWESKRVNPKYGLADKDYARTRKIDEDNQLILYLNQLSLQKLNNLQDVRIRW